MTKNGLLLFIHCIHFHPVLFCAVLLLRKSEIVYDNINKALQDERSSKDK